MVIDKPQCGLDTCKYYFDGNCTNEKRYRTCEFAYFKELDAADRLIELPCKVGDTIYLISESCVGNPVIVDTKYRVSLIDYPRDIFLTKEEAEAKLGDKV